MKDYLITVWLVMLFVLFLGATFSSRGICWRFDGVRHCLALNDK